jgi:hypothetical protein
MRDVLRRLVASRANLGLALGIAAAYLALFLVAVADLTIDGAARSASLFLVAGWENLVFRQQAPFQFEAVAIAEAPGLIWLVSPMNVLIGLALGLLTGLQMALVRIARSCAVACGVSPAAGLLAGLPGLLAGSACCVPILFLLLGVQVTASLIALMGLLIPAAFVFLLAGVVLTLRAAARSCAEAAA